MAPFHPVLVYSLARVAVFAVVALVLRLVLPGLGLFGVLGLALLVSAVVSYLLLARQRDAVTELVARRVEGPRERP